MQRPIARPTTFFSPTPTLVRALLPAALSAATLLPAAHAQPSARAGVTPEAAFAETTSRYHTEFAYVLPSPLALEGTTFGDVDTTEAQVSYQVSVPVSECLAVLAGLELRGTWFDVPGAAPIPDALYETSARIGAHWQFADAWRLQVLLSPGLYSDFQDIDAGDLYVPGLLLAFWDVSPRLQLIGGASVNLRRDLPVIPAFGGRWRFADDWTLLAVFPTPRIEYAASRAVTVFAGAEIIRTAYRVAEDFGDAFGRPRAQRRRPQLQRMAGRGRRPLAHRPGGHRLPRRRLDGRPRIQLRRTRRRTRRRRRPLRPDQPRRHFLNSDLRLAGSPRFR
jgi:hypothetical protein